MSVAMRTLFDLDSPPPLAQRLPLRDYQVQAIEAVHAARARGVTRQLISLPTGAGKTAVASALIAERDYRGVVFLVHRDELATQTVRAIRNADPNLSVGIVKAERDEYRADVVVASVQTLAHAKRRARLCSALQDPRLLIVDEAHHAAARTYLEVIQEVAADLTVGLTATAYRADQKALGAVFDEVVFHYPMIPLIAKGQLANLVGLRIDTEADLDTVRTTHGEFNEHDLEDSVDTPSRNQLVVNAWREHAHAQGRKRTVAFCVTKAHAEHLRDTFRDDGVRAEMVLGETPANERGLIYRGFHEGIIQVLVSVMVLSEGWDEPAADCGLMCRPTKSLGLYVQLAGRLARPYPGKPDALIIDFVDNTSRHALVTLPTLAGREAREAAGLSPDEEPDAPDLRSGMESQGLLEMVEASLRVRQRQAVAVNLFGTSPYVWGESDGRWMTNTGAGYLALFPEGDGFVPVEIQVPTSKLLAPSLRRLFDRPVDVSTARAVAESLVPKNPLTDRDAAWREGYASDKQLAFARNLRLTVPEGATKGQVSELIDRVMFGRLVKKLSLEEAHA